jgi:hypothetical protein
MSNPTKAVSVIMNSTRAACKNQYVLDCSVTLPGELRYKWAPISLYQQIEDGHVEIVGSSSFLKIFVRDGNYLNSQCNMRNFCILLQDIQDYS